MDDDINQQQMFSNSSNDVIVTEETPLIDNHDDESTPLTMMLESVEWNTSKISQVRIYIYMRMSLFFNMFYSFDRYVVKVIFFI